MSNLGFSQKTIGISLDGPYAEYGEFFQRELEKNYSGATYLPGRLSDFASWKKAVMALTGDWTLLACNHDHAFVSKVQEWQGFLTLLDASPYNLAHISHWTEALGWHSLEWKSSEAVGLELGFQASETIGTALFRTTFLQECFAHDFTDGAKFVRPDNPFGPHMTFRQSRVVVPQTEFFRHLDGYGHVGLDASFASALRPQWRIGERGLEQHPWKIAKDPSQPGDLLSLGDVYTLGDSSPKWTENQVRNLSYLATRYRVRLSTLLPLLRALSSWPKTLRALTNCFSDPVFWKSAFAPVSHIAKALKRIV